MLPLILVCQNSRLVSGIVAYLQFWWPCQKQPLIKMAVLYFGRTMSGLPGISFRCNRKRKPCANKKRRTKTSGLVFLLLMCDMQRLRCSSESTSAIDSKSKELPSRQTGDQTFCDYKEVPLYVEYKLLLTLGGLCLRERVVGCKVNKNFWINRCADKGNINGGQDFCSVRLKIIAHNHFAERNINNF